VREMAGQLREMDDQVRTDGWLSEGDGCLGSNQSKKYKMGDISKGVANTL
jgi:hypothetical protein